MAENNKNNYSVNHFLFTFIGECKQIEGSGEEGQQVIIVHSAAPF